MNYATIILDLRKEVFIMEYSRVILEMLERISVLEGKVKELEEKLAGTSAEQTQERNTDKISDKYRKLAEYLTTSSEKCIVLSYAQIEDILGFSLPETARKYKPSFWANTATHSYSSSWMAVGYKARVDKNRDCVTFEKK